MFFQKYQIRIEEVAFDQIHLGGSDALLPVAHFDKNPADRMFGVPFLIKVTDGESMKSVRQRVRERLHVPEVEFDRVSCYFLFCFYRSDGSMEKRNTSSFQYKCALVHSNRVQRYIENDSEEKVRVSDLHNATPSKCSPFIRISFELDKYLIISFPGGGPHNGMLSQLYLGLDHFNRSRTGRGTVHEKAIVIHN